MEIIVTPASVLLVISRFVGKAANNFHFMLFPHMFKLQMLDIRKVIVVLPQAQGKE
jgi:hypothetical protein